MKHKGISFTLMRDYGLNGIFGIHACINGCQIRLSFLSRYYIWLRIPKYHKNNTRELFYSIVDDITTEQEMNEMSKNGKNAYSVIANDIITSVITKRSKGNGK